jgi:hypothetical protein
VIATVRVVYTDGTSDQVQVPGVGPGKIPPESPQEITQIDAGLRRVLGDRYADVLSWQEVE